MAAHRPAPRPALLAAAMLSILFCLAGEALAIVGTVVDEDGQPLAGARVCYVGPQDEVPCVGSDETGFYELADGDWESMRIDAIDHLPLVIPAADYAMPLRLRRAAVLRVVLKDEAGENPVVIGRLWLVSATGRRRGPFEFERPVVRIRSLEPGEMRVVVEVDGYRQERPAAVELVAGEEITLEIPLSQAYSE